MASEYQFLAPEPLAGVDLPAEWEVFKEDFAQFLLAVDKDEAADKVKLALLLRTIGERGKDVYKSFTYETGKSKDNYKDVTDSFDAFCKPRRNLFNARDHFLNCKQKNSSVDEYAPELRKRARYCEFGDQTETLILHTLVIGLDDTKMVDKIKQRETVDLTTVIGMIRRQEEAAKDASSQISVSVDAIKRYQKPASQKKHTQPATSRGTPSSYFSAKCTRCGGAHHSLESCPAKGQSCRMCNKLNHFAKCCQSRQGQSKSKVARPQCNSLFVGCVSRVNGSSEWTVEARVAGISTKVLLDTGAECNTLPEELATRGNLRVRPCLTTLYSYSGHQVKPLGQVEVGVEVGEREATLQFLVVPEGRKAVLGGESCLKLQLVKKVNSVQAAKFNIEEYSDVFQGLGCLEGEHKINIDESVHPVVHSPRRVPEPIRDKVIEELHRMESEGIIFRVDEPTEWVNSLVTVRKPDGSIRICIDPTDLNHAIRREHYPLPTIESIAARIPKAKIFTILDAQKGFWQIQLDRASSLLTTFNSPIGRYAFTRLPFGIKSAPEVFQAAMDRLLEGLDGVAVVMDDILVHAANQEEHDRRLRALLDRCRAKGLKLNKKKCQVSVSEVKYIGHVLSEEGVKADPRKVAAIRELEPPTDKTGVRRIIGMTNYLTKFVPSLSEHLADLRRLTEKKTEFMWTEKENESFNALKERISTLPVLRFYDVSKPVVISVDASKSTIGAVLLQEGRPVAYASKSLTATEVNWSQMEKEMRGVVFGAEHFHSYIYGKPFQIETDHKPLISIVGRSLDKVPPRMLNLLWKLMPYDVQLYYKRGEDLHIADTLSRASYRTGGQEEEIMSLEVEHLPVLNATDNQTNRIRRATAEDEVLQKLRARITSGWPQKRAEAEPELQLFWNVRNSLTYIDGLVFKDQQMVVPRKLRTTMMDIIHQPHLGQVMSIRRARQLVYWPGMSREIAEAVQKCEVCCQNQRAQQRESLQPVEVPKLPWQTVGMHLFQYGNQQFLIIVDYYSGFIEYSKLSASTSPAVIAHVKSVFARWGIPLKVVSDNGPQFSSRAFREFAEEWQFQHRTSSPTYPQSNGMVERAVGVLKGLLTKAEDPYLALLNYRNSPRADGAPSPATRMLGRSTRSLLPESMRSVMATYDPDTHAKLKRSKEV